MRDLLRVLGVTDQPEDVRAAAIREWLETNKPTPMMEFCLVDEGYLGHASDRA